MKFIPLDIGRFLVASRTRGDVEHVVSLIPDEYFGCSCEGYEFNTLTCAHLREACRKRQQGKLRMIVSMKGK